MNNEDLKKITEIKQYMLDPPVSFKLHDYAIGYVQNAIAVLELYPNAIETKEYFQQMLLQLEEGNIPAEELRTTLKEAGRKLSGLTNK